MGHIQMSQKELSRIEIIHRVIKRGITQVRAGELLGISERQVRRLSKRVKNEGNEGLCHRSRGCPSIRHLSAKKAEQIISIYKERYADFGPTFAQEKLTEEGILISRESLRKLLIKEGLWQSRSRRHKAVHVWRERRSSEGELIQIDGSHHRWLEDRLDKQICLMGYIDDATSTVFARFYEYEGVFPVMDSMRRFIEKYGRPRAIYIDRHSTYKTIRKAHIEEELQGQNPLTHFELAMKEIGVALIHARSPQAKGRVERLFGILQDRLIKEMRLANICNIEDANMFLETYLPKHNKRFCVLPKDTVSVWRQPDHNYDPQWTFVRRYTRTILNDYTIRWHNKIFLIQSPSLLLKKQKVEIREAMNGHLRFSTKNNQLIVKEVQSAPKANKPMSMSEAKKRLILALDDGSPKKSWMDGFYIGNKHKTEKKIVKKI